MATTERFDSMETVQRERERLRAQRDERLLQLNGHWAQLREPELQKAIANGAMKVMSRSLFSWHTAKDVASTISPELIGGIAGLAFGGRAKTTAGKILAMGLSAAVPFIAERIGKSGTGTNVMSELERSWQRVKDHVRERREARAEGRTSDGQ